MPSAGLRRVLEPWLRLQHERLARRSEVRKACTYTLKYWQMLIEILDDSCICLGNNAAG